MVPLPLTLTPGEDSQPTTNAVSVVVFIGRSALQSHVNITNIHYFWNTNTCCPSHSHSHSHSHLTLILFNTFVSSLLCADKLTHRLHCFLRRLMRGNGT